MKIIFLLVALVVSALLSSCSHAEALKSQLCLVVRYGVDDRSVLVSRLDIFSAERGFDKDGKSGGNTRYHNDSVDIILLHAPDDFGDIISIFGDVSGEYGKEVELVVRSLNFNEIYYCKENQEMVPPVLIK